MKCTLRLITEYLTCKIPVETAQNAVISPFTLTQSVTEYILISISLDITSGITMAEQLYPARTFLLVLRNYEFFRSRR